jgi:hypothetical protein
MLGNAQGRIDMAECECLPGCPFFNDKMKEKPATAQIYKTNYCLGGNNGPCARHQVKVALGKENVPGDLYPTQENRVPGILAEYRKNQPA